MPKIITNQDIDVKVQLADLELESHVLVSKLKSAYRMDHYEVAGNIEFELIAIYEKQKKLVTQTLKSLLI